MDHSSPLEQIVVIGALSKHYKTEGFFVIPEFTFGTISAILISLLSLVAYKRISKVKWKGKSRSTL